MLILHILALLATEDRCVQYKLLGLALPLPLQVPLQVLLLPPPLLPPLLLLLLLLACMTIFCLSPLQQQLHA